jgi:hypothetical protein
MEVDFIYNLSIILLLQEYNFKAHNHFLEVEFFIYPLKTLL